MSQNDALTLIRLARKYPEYNEPLLAVVELELSNGDHPQASPEEGIKASIAYPIEVFHFAWGKREHSGMLFGDRAITVNGVRYDLPSPAAISVTGNSVNGWDWWYYEDPVSGTIRPIGYLRRSGLI